MKKVSTETTGLLSLIMIAVVGIFSVGQLIFCMIGGETVLGWLENAHINYYSDSTAISSKMTQFIMDKSFQNLFSVSYIRVMSMYVFVLCIPLLYALFNIYFISRNGQSKKPFRSSTSACLRSITISFIAEFVFATLFFVVLKIIMRTLPFYFMYTMLAVALYSLVIVVFSMTISGLINRMGALRNEHAKQVRKQKQEAAAVNRPIEVEPSEEISYETASIKDRVSEILSGDKMDVKNDKEEKPVPEKPAFTSNFDDVLSSIESEKPSEAEEKVEETKE